MTIEEQLRVAFELSNVKCQNLNALVNDVIKVKTPNDSYALKLYNPAWRNASEVQWEIDLTLHLINNGVPAAKPIQGKSGDYLQTFVIDGQDRVAVLFKWLLGEKPKPGLDTYGLVGKTAALIHNAADNFTPGIIREQYDAKTLIDEQLELIKTPLIESGQWQRVFDLTKRLRAIIENPALDYGICHMDLTLDNVHRDGDALTVFDFDSACVCWRAYEPYGVLQASEDRFKAWLEGYRSVRKFSKDDEKAVAAFVILGDIGNTVWKLGYAKSSRGEPLMQTNELSQVVDEWLEWERENI